MHQQTLQKAFETLTAQMHCHCRDGVAFSSYEANSSDSCQVPLHSKRLCRVASRKAAFIVEASRCRSTVGNYF